jgi:RNA polymerase-binding protein DksA
MSEVLNWRPARESDPVNETGGRRGGNMVILARDQFLQMLHGKRTQLQAQLGRDDPWMDEHIRSGNHMADRATQAFEQAKGLAVRTCLTESLVDVDHALAKFALGTYGYCECCGGEIDWARLEAKPESRLCIRCKHRSEFGR